MCLFPFLPTPVCSITYVDTAQPLHPHEALTRSLNFRGELHLRVLRNLRHGLLRL